MARNSMPDQLRVFIGYDPRQPIAYSVLEHSIRTRSSRPVAITGLVLSQLPITRRGLTEFTYSRFLVPWLCDFQGSALFLDADMLILGDIAELFSYADCIAADVQVNKQQPPFEWASAMLFNCMRCRRLTPEFVDDPKNALFDFGWAKSVGEFPAGWNSCVGYAEADSPNLVHYTQGIPVWPETRGKHKEDRYWIEAHKEMNSTVSWKELMGESVHAQRMAAND